MYELYIVDQKCGVGQKFLYGEYDTIEEAESAELAILAAGYVILTGETGNPTKRTIPYHAIVRFEIVEKE